MRAPISAAKELAELGFDLVSLATNHTMNFGAKGIPGHDPVARCSRRQARRLRRIPIRGHSPAGAYSRGSVGSLLQFLFGPATRGQCDGG
ncbi:hypothetical protein MSMEI_3251 [Mycolicibacterium smegmatis MC2 155]|uniref:Uncharacterized protein n=1 Tax=Mycolicibacterium smegmatis (strain ATCC 700084 / mc(2)155) TaxID=246196 RepID=I7GB09_MYCS2|nr:hypothetical protein MSMEI_3251 [Mycolicibacterium smegmatis MC2 155]